MPMPSKEGKEERGKGVIGGGGKKQSANGEGKGKAARGEVGFPAAEKITGRAIDA